MTKTGKIILWTIISIFVLSMIFYIYSYVNRVKTINVSPKPQMQPAPAETPSNASVTNTPDIASFSFETPIGENGESIIETINFDKNLNLAAIGDNMVNISETVPVIMTNESDSEDIQEVFFLESIGAFAGRDANKLYTTVNGFTYSMPVGLATNNIAKQID